MREIKDIRALCEAATPGPWYHSRFVDGLQYRKMSKEWKEQADNEERTHVIRGPGVLGKAQGIMVFKFVSPEDKAFVVASRTLVPDLLAALEAKDAEIARLQEVVDREKATIDKILAVIWEAC